MCGDPSIAYVALTSPVYFPELKKVICVWQELYHGNSNHPMVGCASSDTPAPSLVAPSAASLGDLTSVPPGSLRPTVAQKEPPVLGELAQDVLEMQMSQMREAPIPWMLEAPTTQMLDGSGATLLLGVPTWVEPGVDDAPLGAVSIEANRAGPRPSDDVKSPFHDLVVWGTDSSMLGHKSPGDTVPAPGSSGAVGSGVAKLLLSGYLGSSFPPVKWGQVENNMEQACSQVEAVKRMLQEMLATVGRDILHPIRVSLKKSGKFT
jgi:hypothetical protein